MGSVSNSASLNGANDNKPTVETLNGLYSQDNNQLSGSNQSKSIFGDIAQNGGQITRSYADNSRYEYADNSRFQYSDTRTNTNTNSGNTTTTVTDGGAIAAMFAVARDAIKSNQQFSNVMQTMQAQTLSAFTPIAKTVLTQSEKTGNLLQSMQTGAQKAADTAEQSGNVLDDAKKFISDNPLLLVGVAVLIWFVWGRK